MFQVGLPDEKESILYKVATPSSTKNCPDHSKKSRRKKFRKQSKSSSSDSEPMIAEAILEKNEVNLEKGVEENRLPIDISSKVRRGIIDSDARKETIPKQLALTMFR